MRLPISGAFLVVLAPLGFIAFERGWMQRNWGRWLFGGLAITLGFVFFPEHGVDFILLKKVKLLLALGVTLTLSIPALGKTIRRFLLSVLVLIAGVNYYNYFDFHGDRTWTHLHDVAHYYMGGKYFDELAHNQLYTAFLRAELEEFDGQFIAQEARNLVTYELEPIDQLLEDSPAVKGQFSPSRWIEFKHDLRFFREKLGPHWPVVLKDHGFNPTPFWTLIGGNLANAVQVEKLTWLTLIDPLGLVIIAGALGWAFGFETALLGLLYFFLAYGSGFGWTGGAFLRYGWLVALVLSVAALAKERVFLSGCFLAIAAALRVFPIFFALGLFGQALYSLWNRKTLLPFHRKFFTGLILSGSLCFLLTAVVPGSFDSWLWFRKNTQQQVKNLAPNQIGLTNAIAYRSGEGLVSEAEFKEIKNRRNGLYRIQLFGLGIPLIAGLLGLSIRRPPLEAYFLGALAILAVLNLAAYYWVFLLLGVAVYRDRLRNLRLLFSLEVLTGFVLLFENREGLIFIDRSLLVASLLVLLILSPRNPNQAKPSPLPLGPQTSDRIAP